MAFSLVAQQWTLFVVEEDSRNRDHNLRGNNKLKIIYYPTYNVHEQMSNIDHFSNNAAADCSYMSPPDLNLEILDSIHGELKKYFEIAKDYHLIQALCLQQYQVCINELRYYPLYPIFQLIGCKHIVATSNMPLESIYYYYLGLLPNIIHNGIPGLFIFVNTQFLIDFEAMSDILIDQEKIINIGGIAIQQNNQALNRQEANIFNFASQNDKQIILVSFGTMINSQHLTDIQIYNLVENFSQFNYLFIWAIEDVNYKIFSILYNYNRTNNILDEDNKIFIYERVNQKAILANPLTILFISHCGINSSIEAVKYGKPLLCVPFIADQFYNSQALASREVAGIVDKDDNFENLEQYISYAISLHQNMHNLSELMNDINPVQTFLEKIAELHD
uniref:glucuronosyltransferase n=1 Tax=Meloidogyne floridensis TaxID=298350 RepID=A0A915NGD4_9BILA